MRKLKTNMARDTDTSRFLSDQGWTVLRFWEHEEPASVADQVQAAVLPTP